MYISTLISLLKAAWLVAFFTQKSHFEAFILNHPLCTHNIHAIRTLAVSKESYSRVNESKQQVNSFIIYNLDSIERVNGNWQSENLEKKKNACEKNAPPRLDLAPFERPIAV